ncbi:PolC-type DNA polymerase III N-terminal domain-containing protein [Bacillus cereus]|uniref:PolC-type DNA polymerase III N-terminal domain-containing protein n=1 Tax=Bacillus cereus TaxID=1396 RepID=UPI000A9F2D6B|nr:PolC-type DNA polymerase III N-terminal domain-containing protein [Bacillus cereus]
MSLTNEQKERFQILLQQLQIPDDLINQYLQGGGIERLVIDKANKSWHFNLQVPRILPTELYELLETKLKQSFSHIARTTFALETENKQFTEEEVRAYGHLYGTNYIFTYVCLFKEAASAGEWSEVTYKCE